MWGSLPSHTPNPLCPPHSNNPDDVAMRLAFIGDEMEVRWMLPRVGELPGMAMYRWAAPRAPGGDCSPASSPESLHRQSPAPAPGRQSGTQVPFSAASSSQDRAFLKGS